MAKYAVSLGEYSKTVILEASEAKVAMANVVTCMDQGQIALTPQEKEKESWWFARNVSKSSDEFVLKSREEAKKFLQSVRGDVVELFWFVSLDGHSTPEQQKIVNQKFKTKKNFNKKNILE